MAFGSRRPGFEPKAQKHLLVILIRTAQRSCRRPIVFLIILIIIRAAQRSWPPYCFSHYSLYTNYSSRQIFSALVHHRDLVLVPLEPSWDVRKFYKPDEFAFVRPPRPKNRLTISYLGYIALRICATVSRFRIWTRLILCYIASGDIFTLSPIVRWLRTFAASKPILITLFLYLK